MAEIKIEDLLDLYGQAVARCGSESDEAKSVAATLIQEFDFLGSREALVISTAKPEALAERTKTLMDQLAAARAACGEAAEELEAQDACGESVNYPLMRKLRAIAEGKEA